MEAAVRLTWHKGSGPFRGIKSLSGHGWLGLIDSQEGARIAINKIKRKNTFQLQLKVLKLLVIRSTNEKGDI